MRRVVFVDLCAAAAPVLHVASATGWRKGTFAVCVNASATDDEMSATPIMTKFIMGCRFPPTLLGVNVILQYQIVCGSMRE